MLKNRHDPDSIFRKLIFQVISQSRPDPDYEFYGLILSTYSVRTERDTEDIL